MQALQLQCRAMHIMVPAFGIQGMHCGASSLCCSTAILVWSNACWGCGVWFVTSHLATHCPASHGMYTGRGHSGSNAGHLRYKQLLKLQQSPCLLGSWAAKGSAVIYLQAHGRRKRNRNKLHTLPDAMLQVAKHDGTELVDP